jgi:3-oxoacyl-(acyl-carrier-protein) synthase
LAASGSIECVGTLLQFDKEKLFGNVNCEDIHPDIENRIDKNKIPLKTTDYRPEIIAKASFGFGDVNACVIFGRFNDE